MSLLKGPGKRGYIVADTLLPTQMFPRLPARATFVADTNFVSGTQKMFLILCPQQMFPSLRSSRNIMGNNVSASFARALKDLARQGLISFTKHKRPISSEDLEVLYAANQLGLNPPESFANLAWFNTILYFA